VPLDTETPQSPGWWIKVLTRQLNRRNDNPRWTRHGVREGRPGLNLLDAYFRGDPPLPEIASGWRAGFQHILRLSRMNFAELVIEPTRERMVPLGFRTAVSGDEESGDLEASSVLAVNDFALKFTDISQWMLTLGDAYSIVGFPVDGSTVPLVTAEDPRQVITAHDPATGKTLAGLKLFRDDWDAADFAYLYRDGLVSPFIRKSKTTMIGSSRFMSGGWDEFGGDIRLPIKGNAVSRFSNRNGRGEFEPHTDVLDRINNTILDRVTIAKIQAFRQRAARGLPDRYPQGHPMAGQVIDYGDVFTADPGAMWLLPPGVEMWESQPVDLTPIRMAIKDDVEYLAAVTRTPLHLITPDAASGSAEGASLMREGLVFQTEDRRLRAEAGLSNQMSIVFEWMGDRIRADRSKVETIWAPAERLSLQEKAQAASLLQNILPSAMIQELVLQMTPTQIQRAQALRGDDLFTTPTVTPPAAPSRAAVPALTASGQ